MDESRARFAGEAEAEVRSRRKERIEYEAKLLRVIEERAREKAVGKSSRREAKLVELAGQWRSATIVREFLEELEKRCADDSDIEELIELGLELANELDPTSKPEELSGMLMAAMDIDEREWRIGRGW